MTESLKSYTIRQYPPSQLLDNGTYSDNDLTYTSSITDGTDISGTQYGRGSYIVKYSSYKENNNNLIARYKFDKNATNMLLDSTGNENNLINYGSTFDNTNYKVGNGSSYFNGNSQYISIPSTINPYTIWNNNGITFSLWSKLSTSSGLSASLLSFGDSTNKANNIEPIAKGIKQYPETPSTNADSWADNGYNVVCKTSDAILSPQISCYLFNNSIVSPDHYHSALLFSGFSPYNYTGSTSFKGANGLVIYIDLGRSIILRNMRIAPRDNAAYPTLNFLGAMPNTFKIYASNDGACWTSNTHSSWTEIHSQTTSLTYNYNQFTNFGNFSTNTTAYRYFAMVVYNLIGNYTYLTFSEWDIFGTYDITPISNILLDRVTKNTGMSGWVQIKHLPGGPELANNTGNNGRPWFSGNTFNGSTVNNYTIGNASNNLAEWSIPFDSANVQFYLFYENTNDFNSEWNDRWAVIRKSDMVEVNYPNWKPLYKALNYPNGKTEGLQYNRINNIENADPNLNIKHLKIDGTVNDIGPYIKGPHCLYIENSTTHWWGAPPAEVNVFVKYTADTSSDSSNYKYLSFVHSGESETQTSYTVNFPENTECDILLVGGGGGGGQQNAGGGGAGGLVLIQNFQANGSYTINVGKGGNGGNGAIHVGGNGSVGNNTTFIKSDNSVIITANGGGGGGGGGAFQPIIATNGGSGGGGGWASANGTQTQKSQSQIGIISPAIINQFGENGGHGGGDGNSFPGGGGGGAGGTGATSTSNTTGQNGGLGIDRVGTFIFSEKFSSSIGDNGWFAGGGGSGGDGTSDGYGNGGSTLYGGGGGNGDGIGRGINGINGTGGGGGSIRDPSATLGGNGGSGIVLIRYKLKQTVTSNSLNIIEPNITSGGTITPVTFGTDYKYLTFTNKGENQTVYTVNFPENAECDILIVGGGGSGGVRDSGGGGGGGVVLRRNYTISSNTTTTIYVGKGGNYIIPGQTSNNGFDSSIVIGSTTLTAIGGGGGGGNTGSLYGGRSGGSGGGGGYGTSAGTGTQPTSASGGYGNNGSNSPGGYVGGGGGGAGSAGKTDGNENIGRTGGDGIDMSAIFGTMVGDNGWFAGGGGSGGYTSGSYGNGGVNRFGGASKGETATATDAMPNTGGGGGSVQNGWNVGDRSGGGGSGIVIIRYKLSKILPTNININNLVAYYKFNDSNSLGLDSNPSSTKYNLTPTIVGGTGGYNTTTAIEGASFQATNDGDRLEGDFPLKSIYDSSTTGISISCWYYKKLATYDNIYNTHLFHFHNPSDSSQWINMSVSHYNNVYIANFSFSYINGETYCSGWGPSQAFDTWYHVVLILNKSGNIKVYFNGTNLNLVPGTTDGTIRWYNSSTYPLPQCPNITKLKIFTNVGLGAFNGNIDEFYVFNKELTQAEVTSLYNKTIKSNSLNIIEPSITSGGTITPVSVGIDYKYLEFSSTPDLIHNFTDFNTEATWKAKANSIPGFTYNFAVYFADGYAGLWSPENNVGYIEYQLPSSYNNLTVNFGNIYYQSEVRLLINGVVKKSATGNQGSLIHTQSYNVGDILRIEELYAIMNADLIITLTKTTPNLIYDFSSYNSEATWKAYADTIPNFTYSLNTFLTPYDNDAVWTGDRVIGWIQMTLPSTHNFLSITYGLGVQGVEEVRLLINGVEKSRATPTNRLVTYSQAYNVGDVVRIEETFSTMSANIIITLTSINQTSYTVNFPENTQCSALIIGNPNYTYLQNLSLYGTYNIVVGNTSSITKSDNSITYNNSVTAQTVPFTNTITDTTITYNLVPKVIIRYKLTKTITSNSQDEITSDNWIAINKNSTNNDIKFEIQNSTGTGSSYTLTGYSYNNGLVTGTHEDGASTTYVNLLNLGIQLGSILTNWSFNTKITGKSITPLILEDTGSANYVIRGIGTSRYITTTGLNSYPFELVQGTNVFSTSNYKFGWKDGTTTSTNSGVISWSTNNAVAQTTYALSGNSSTNISLNTTYNFGNQSLGNRTYSFKLDFNSTTSIIDNTWHHIIWSISSTGVWSIYIDNQYINPNITRSLFNITYARQYIGKSLFSSNGWLIGNIDDLRIYNKVLTTNEIASIYNNPRNVYPLIIFKNDPAYWSKIDISSSQPNWAGNYQLVAPYSYLDNSYLVNNFTGDYVTIKLPYKIYLTKYVICSTINKLHKAPQNFSIYGSIDGVIWNKIVEKHLTSTSYINTQIPNSTNSTGYYTDDETNSTVAYDYYGIVINKLIGPLDASDNNLSFSLWNIYGTNDLKDRSYFEFGLVTDTSKTFGSSLKDGLIKANNSNIFIKSGNTNTAALSIGTNNRVGVGKNIANEAFDVSGSLIANEYRIKNQNYPIIDASSNITASGNTDISGNLTLNNNKFVVNASSGNLSVAGTLDISKNININNGKTIIDSSGNIKSQGNFDLSSNININNYVLVDASGSVIMNNTLDISNNATLRSNLDIKGNIKSSAFTTNSSINKVSIRNTSVDPSYNFHVSGSTRLEGNLDVDGNIIIVDTVQQTSEQFIINNDGNTVALTVKQIGAQPIIDLRDDDKSVFYLADNGLLGLGTTTPSCTVDVSGSCFVQQTLDVSGNLNIGGNTYLSENIQFNDILDVSRNVNINNKFFVDPSGNIDICGNMLIYGYLISNGNNANSGGFQQDGNAIINGELRVLYNIDISQNLRVLDTFIVDASGNIKSKGQFNLSNNLRNGSNYSINTVGNVYSAGNIDISKNFNINNGVFSADISGNIIVNGFIDISKNLYVNGNKFTIDQNGNITAMGTIDISNNLTINTNKFIVDASGNIKSVGNLDISNNFIINNGAFKIDNNGNISSQNNFDISGNMSINGQKITVSNTGNIKSAGKLDISNNFSINNDKFAVDSSGNTIAKGNVDISNNLSIGNNTFNVDASGNIQSSGTLDVSQNLKIGSTLLTVDHQNKRVGINTTTPEYSLDISGQIMTNKAIMGSTNTTTDTSTDTTTTTIDISSVTITMNNTPVTPTQINSNEYYYIFDSTTSNYNFTCTKDVKCDILMIGGGGSGGTDRAGGGGAGACIVYKDYVMNGTYKIKVGDKGLKVNSGNGNNGYDSEISNLTESTIYFRAKGGGGGGVHIANGVNGGCGGGGGSQGNYLGGSASSLNIVNSVANISPSSTSSYVVYGNIGGRTSFPYTGSNLPEMNGAGGGGIGQGGTLSGALNAVDAPQYNGGKGGDGLYKATINGIDYNFKNYFGVNGKLESDTYYYIGGGGGGGDHSTGVGGVGGKGGGGTGGDDTVGFDALSYGSGGGGGGGTNKVGGDGSAGIVIIRFKLTNTTTSNSQVNIIEPNITSGGPITPVTIGTDYKYLSFTYQAPLIEQKTGVGGWRLVRFLPPNLGRWYTGNYMNTTTINVPSIGTPYDYTNEWAVPFGTFDEMVFGTFDMTHWLQCAKSSVIGAYSFTSRNVIKSSARNYPHTVKWWNRTADINGGEDPWISINDMDSDGLIVYGENNFSSNGAIRDAYGGMAVWVRDSTATTVLQTPYAVNFSENTECDILVVGGGGAGGNDRGGGGGGGGVVYSVNQILTAGTYTINVGKGGIGNTSGTTGGTGTRGTNGNNSSISGNNFTTITAIGGGTGGSCNPSVKNGLDGGSGGGGSQYGGAGSGGSGTIGQGKNGGNGYEGGAAGGGGGFVDVGTNANSTNAGNGGIGLSNSITGTTVIYGSGGGGGGSFATGATGAYIQVFGIGGSSGAGNGANKNTNGVNATIYGCGGGGGGLADTIVTKGGDGGSGIVIIRYKLTKTITSNSQVNIVEPKSLNVESIYPPYRYFTYNDTNGIYTVQNGSIEASNSTNFSYTYSYNDPANTQGNNEQTTSTFKNTYGMGLYKFSVGGTQAAGGRSSGIFIYGLSSDYSISTSGNRPALNHDDNSALPDGAGWYVGTGWTNSTTYNSSYYYNTTFQGAWIKIEMPIGIILSSFKILGGVQKYRAPKAFKIYGSNTNTTTASDWTLLHTETNYTYTAGGDFGVKQTVNNNLMFKNYLMVVSEQHTYDAGLLVFQGWYIYGKEEITPVPIGTDYKYLTFTNDTPIALSSDSTNLKAWYKFDGDYNDSSSSGYHLTNNSTILASTYNIAGQAVEFDNTDSLMFPATFNPYTIWNGNGITFSIWVRFTSITNWARLIDLQQSTNLDNGIFISIKGTPGGFESAMYIKIGSTAFNYSNWSNSLISQLNVWRHIVVSLSSSGALNVYVDNIKINSNETATIPNLTWGFRYINKSAFSVDGVFNGQMDDFRVYNKVLSATEVSQLYNISTPTTYTVNFPTEGTECSALIVGNPNYTYLQNLRLSGTYNIVVGNTSSITKSDNSINYNNSVTTQIVPFTNTITDSTVTYNLVPKVIIRYKLTKTITSNTQNIIEPTVSETIERIYPPIRNATSNTTTITGQTYGNGVYIVSASSNHPGEEPFKIINTNNTGWTQSWTSYGGTPAGTYTGTFSLGGYSGECVKIQLPYRIKLTRYIIEASSIGGVNRAPSIYKIFGSNDDSNWVEIHHKSVALISSNYVSNKFEETISNTNYYTYYALVVNKNIGIDTWLSIGEWQIYGREKITPESIDANYKYLAFTYQTPPSVVLREYPPSAMTINSTTLSVGGTDASGNTYGAGTYIINYPYGISDIAVYTLFNKSIGYNHIGSIGALYNGYYIGDFCNDTRTSFGTYFGSCKGTLNDRVWTYLSSSTTGISIDLTQDTNSNKYYGSTFTYSLPSPIYLQNLQLYNRSAYSTFAAQAPKSFRVYGMNIGDNGWTQIANYSNLNAWTSYISTSSTTASNIIWDGTSGAESLTFKINANTSYNMYGFVVNTLLGSNENFTLAEIKLFGTDYYVPPSGQIQYTVNFPENTECDILVVGGGGAGGASVGGGGGAGGVVYQKNITLNGIYTILVGKGGDNTSSTTSTPNEDSVHNGLSSQIMYQNNILLVNGVSFEGKGGGGGGSRIGEPPGNLDGGFDGGSGGGNSVSGNGIPANPGSSTQENTLLLNGTNVKGGYNSIKTTENWMAGGGAGTGNSNSGMNGGAGIQLDITGSLQWYAAGGGAGRISTSAGGIGGSGIGGSGKSNTSASNSLIVPTQVNGTNNTGSGGGGGGYYYGYIANGPDGDGGGAGGSGIVIIRYKFTKTITSNSQVNIVEPKSLNIESIYPPYRYFTYNDANGIYTVQNGSIEAGNSTNFSYTYSYNDPANTQGNNEQTSSTFKNTYGMGLYKFSVGGIQAYGGTSSGLFIYGLSSDYSISTSGNRPAVNSDDNSALPDGSGWYHGSGWTNSTTYNSSYYYNTTFQGAWIKIEMPIGIILSSFKILGGVQKYRSPKAFKIYGSNTNTTTASDWTLLHTETNYTYNAGGDFGVKQTVNNNLIFKNYLMVVSEQHTYDAGWLVFQGWYIYGKEEITPETIDADYKYLVFKNNGSNQTQYTINFLENTECDILVVGGGGGGGASVGSGGGAGGLSYYSNVSIAIGTYTIIVGGGGTGAVNYLARGANGYNSSAFGNTSYGGGGGSGQSWVYNTSGTASGTLQTTSANQGSGAGGTRYKTIGNEGTVGQGNTGGNEVEGGNIFAAGGGGGAGGVGGNGSLISLAGVGGIGVSSTITGASIDYAGGGGGGAENLVNGSWVHSGGTATHGGGAGGDYGSNGTNGKGGGGGGGYTSGGNGGSGIVIVRYKFTKTINNDSTQIIYSNDATFGYRDTSASFIPSIVQLSTGQTYINSLSQYINFNFGNNNKCKMDASGNLTLNGDIFIYSDGRIKENVTTITSALDKVNELSGITYNIINKPRKQIGVIAQEVEKVLPEVIKEEEGMKTVAYPNMVGLLIEALKELNDRVDQTE